MAKKGVAKIFQNGRSQAVRLPREFRFAGKEVRISKVGNTVVLEPMIPDVRAWFAEIDRLRPKDFMKGGRKQPRAPKRKIFE